MEIQREIRRFIQEGLSRDVGAVDNGESLLEAGVIDSMGVLQLVGFIEKRYGVPVSEDEMMPENFDSIDAIAAFVARRRSGNGA